MIEYNIEIKKDGKFYVGYCLEIPQGRGQGDTKADAINDTKRAIKLCKSYLDDKKTATTHKFELQSKLHATNNIT